MTTGWNTWRAAVGWIAMVAVVLVSPAMVRGQTTFPEGPGWVEPSPPLTAAGRDNIDYRAGQHLGREYTGRGYQEYVHDQNVHAGGCPPAGCVECCFGPGLYWTGPCSNWRRPCTQKQPYRPCYTPVYAGYRPSDWYVSGEFLALFRDTDGGQVFATLGPDPASVALSTSSFDGDFATGFRALIGRQLSTNYRVEGSFFGSHSWSDSATVFNNDPNAIAGTGNLFSPFTAFGNPANLTLDYNNRATASFSSTLNNAEINLRYRFNMAPGPAEASFLLGARYIGIEENLQYSTSNQGGFTNRLNVDTSNDLIAVQAGFLGQFLLRPRLWLDVEAKGGIASNDASQASTYQLTPGGQFAGNRGETATSFIGEASVVANWQFHPNVTFRAGYQAMWLTGIALAERNFATDLSQLTAGPAQLDHTGDVVYHGLNVGVVWSR